MQCTHSQTYEYKPAGGRSHLRCCACDRFLEWNEPPSTDKKGKRQKLDTDVKNCYYCGAIATKLCDGKGCDRPLCPTHAFQSGVFIACGRGKGGKRVNHTDTVDYCPECQQRRGIG